MYFLNQVGNDLYVARKVRLADGTIVAQTVGQVFEDRVEFDQVAEGCNLDQLRDLTEQEVHKIMTLIDPIQ